VVYFLENAQRSQCDVLEIADGRGDYIQRARHNDELAVFTSGKFLQT